MAVRLQKNDRILLGSALFILLAGAAWFSFFGKEAGAAVKVTVNGQMYGVYSLGKDREVEIVIGEKVTNVLRIHNQKADMFAADCPDKLCVHQKAIFRQSETIVCLPNKVVVEVTGGEEADLDSVT